ncbi:MAG: LysM peptidoglycan-binding domain-containing protein [Lachnospiraceae bacterium]|nr:LysM peptidoglycan-binding domain-containing protein [Lachnospiraceae bacterium]
MRREERMNTYNSGCDREAYDYRKMMWHRKRAVQVRRERGILAAGIIAAVLVLSIFIGGLRSNINASEAGVISKKCYTNITVQKGDTLWSIAKEYTDGSNASVRAMVDEIKEINKIAFYEPIKSGERLIIPYVVYDEV